MMLDILINQKYADVKFAIYLIKSSTYVDYESITEVFDDLDNLVIFNGQANMDTDYFIQFKNLNIEYYKYLFIYIDSSKQSSCSGIKFNYRFYKSDDSSPFEVKMKWNKNNNHIYKSNVENTVDTTVIGTVNTNVVNTVSANVENTVHAKVTNTVSVERSVFY